MPKVKANKSRVHHKAVGNKEAVAAATAASTAAKPAASTESMQLMKEQFGLEFEEDRIDKKDKRRLKHDKWISKLEATYNPQKKKKKSGKNQTLSVDFGSFHDVLSTIDPTKVLQADSTTSGSKSGSKSKAGAKSTPAQTQATASASSAIERQQFMIHADSSKPLQSKKAKKKAAMQEILRFQNVLAHPAFKSNPLLTIQQHVKNTMEMAPPEPTAASATGAPELMED
ncbi:hypothetical protein BGX26_000307 [Mortierella sp. AD094]|nr:hypothetical protein BGX26_000307 [Mortierella sp. AD094]